MAENIGKIVVSIEAEVAELRKGLARAEAEFKKSADRIVGEQKNLASKVKKSWTEFSNKLNVVSMAANIAMKAWNALDGVLSVVTDSTLNASNKITGTMDAIEKSSIPVVSQFMAIGRGIHGWVSGERQLAIEAAKARSNVRQLWEQGIKRHKTEQDNIKLLQDFTSIILKNHEDIENMNMAGSVADKLKLKHLRERAKLEDEYAELVKKNTGVSQEFLAGEEHKMRIALQYLNQIQSREIDALNELQDKEQKIKDEQFARDKERSDRLAKIDIDNANRVAEKTLSLEEQLHIMEAKQAGDEEKARTLAIEARYRKMGEGATKAQMAIISQMKAIEMAGVGGAAPSATTGGGGTASISTAAGSFTVASGGAGENKKQTSLLRRIAESNEKVVEELTKSGGSGATIIVAS